MEKIYLLSCQNALPFVQSVLQELGKFCTQNEFHFVKSSENYFANGEVKTVIEESVRGKEVFIVQSVESSQYNQNVLHKRTLNDNLMALFTAIDAAQRAGAKAVHVLLLPYPYSRQDKQKSREPITARIIAQFLESLNVHTLITVDIHAESIAGFFRKTHFLNINTSNLLIKHFLQNYGQEMEDLVVVSPDVGGAVRARYYASKLQANLALVSKERDYTQLNKVEKVTLIGDVQDKYALIVDDMIDTGGTMVNVVKLLKENSVKKILIAAPLGLFSSPCAQRFDSLFQEKLLDKVIVTNAINHGDAFAFDHEWLEVISLAPFFAQLFVCLAKKGSVTELLENI